MKKYLIIGFVVFLAVGVTEVGAQKTPSTELAYAIGSDPSAGTSDDGVPDSILSINLAGAESWDAFFDPDNQIFNEAMGAGAIVTGTSWNLTIATVGASWLSEATALLGSTSTPQIVVTPGVGDDNTGTSPYAGSVDFTDVALPNIVLDADGVFLVELAESFDDVADAIDANYTAGAYDFSFIAGAPVPTMPKAAMLVLVVMLLALSAWLLRRRSSET